MTFGFIKSLGRTGAHRQSLSAFFRPPFAGSQTPFSGVRFPSLVLFETKTGGAEGNRTPDLLNAIQALSQLSYNPISLQCRMSYSAFLLNMQVQNS